MPRSVVSRTRCHVHVWYGGAHAMKWRVPITF